MRWWGRRRRRVSFVFKPLTLGVLEQACAVVGVSMDDVLEGDPEALDAAEFLPSRAGRFFEAVLAEPVDVSDLDPEAAQHVFELAAADFFLNAWEMPFKQQANKLYNFIGGQVYPTVVPRPVQYVVRWVNTIRRIITRWRM